MAAKQKKHAGLFTTVIVLVLLFVVGYQLVHTRAQLAAAQAEQSALKAQLAEQRQENASIEAALDRAQDVEYLQELARDQLGMVTPGQKDFYDISN